MFAIKNRMVQISYDFPNNKKSETCLCGQEENMEHIYLCKILNKEKEQLIQTDIQYKYQRTNYNIQNI